MKLLYIDLMDSGLVGGYLCSASAIQSNDSIKLFMEKPPITQQDSSSIEFFLSTQNPTSLKNCAVLTESDLLVDVRKLAVNWPLNKTQLRATFLNEGIISFTTNEQLLSISYKPIPYTSDFLYIRVPGGLSQIKFSAFVTATPLHLNNNSFNINLATNNGSSMPHPPAILASPPEIAATAVPSRQSPTVRQHPPSVTNRESWRSVAPQTSPPPPNPQIQPFAVRHRTPASETAIQPPHAFVQRPPADLPRNNPPQAQRQHPPQPQLQHPLQAQLQHPPQPQRQHPPQPQRQHPPQPQLQHPPRAQQSQQNTSNGQRRPPTTTTTTICSNGIGRGRHNRPAQLRPGESSPSDDSPSPPVRHWPSCNPSAPSTTTNVAPTSTISHANSARSTPSSGVYSLCGIDSSTAPPPAGGSNAEHFASLQNVTNRQLPPPNAVCNPSLFGGTCAITPECIICNVEKVQLSFACGHYVTCSSCYQKLEDAVVSKSGLPTLNEQSQQHVLCPLCRKQINRAQVIQVQTGGRTTCSCQRVCVRCGDVNLNSVASCGHKIACYRCSKVLATKVRFGQGKHECEECGSQVHKFHKIYPSAEIGEGSSNGSVPTEA